MPTNNPRVNVTLEEDALEMLQLLAKRAHTSVAGLARKFILDAIENDEDMALCKLAEKRLAEDEGKPRISHEDFWA